jgi:multimeric flavodoxin WrbA
MDMKITLINGCDTNNTFYNEIIENICEYLKKKEVIYTAKDLNRLNIKICTGCDSCQSIKPGLCAIDDSINDLLKEYVNSDIAIIITSIQFGTCNSITKKFIDRTQPLFLPYQIFKKGKNSMKNRYDKYPDIIFIGIADNTDNDSIEAFKDTFMNCNLSIQSNKVNVLIIDNELDFKNLNICS